MFVEGISECYWTNEVSRGTFSFLEGRELDFIKYLPGAGHFPHRRSWFSR